MNWFFAGFIVTGVILLAVDSICTYEEELA
jgi:hypothetical protein